MVAEIRYGVETIDHIAIPVRDLEVNQNFYLKYLGTEISKPPDVTPTAARAKLMFSPAKISSAYTCRESTLARLASAGPRIGISVTSEQFDQIEQDLLLTNHPFKRPGPTFGRSAD